jgi:hypothetical protein
MSNKQKCHFIFLSFEESENRGRKRPFLGGLMPAGWEEV